MAEVDFAKPPDKLIDVQLKFLTFLQSVGMRFFRCGHCRACADQFCVQVAKALRVTFEVGAQSANLMIDALQLDEVRYCRVHGGHNSNTAPRPARLNRDAQPNVAL